MKITIVSALLLSLSSFAQVDQIISDLLIAKQHPSYKPNYLITKCIDATVKKLRSADLPSTQELEIFIEKMPTQDMFEESVFHYGGVYPQMSSSNWSSFIERSKASQWKFYPQGEMANIAGGVGFYVSKHPTNSAEYGSGFTQLKLNPKARVFNIVNDNAEQGTSYDFNEEYLALLERFNSSDELIQNCWDSSLEMNQGPNYNGSRVQLYVFAKLANASIIKYSRDTTGWFTIIDGSAISSNQSERFNSNRDIRKNEVMSYLYEKNLKEFLRLTKHYDINKYVESLTVEKDFYKMVSFYKFLANNENAHEYGRVLEYYGSRQRIIAEYKKLPLKTICSTKRRSRIFRKSKTTYTDQDVQKMVDEILSYTNESC